MHLKKTTSKWLHYAVDFPSAHVTEHKENNTVLGEYFQPRNNDHAPLAILIHGWGDRSTILCKMMARTLTKKGIASFIFYQVFHTSRMPEMIKNRVPLMMTSDEWFEGYRSSVIEVRQIMDWASSRPELDKEQIGLVGISLGGFVSSITMGIDKRVKAGVFIISGGNSEKITWNTKNEALVKGHGCTHEECLHIRSSYQQYLADTAEKGFGNVTPVKHCYLTDALTFAPYLRGRPILMMNALWDETIPRVATVEFWEACHKPDIVWLPGTHVSFWLWYPLIEGRIMGFLDSTFGMSSKGRA